VATMNRRFPMMQVAATGEVQGGRQRSPHMIEGRVVPYLRVANVFDGYIDFSDINEMPFKQREIETFRLIPGDILLNEGQSVELVGRCAMYVDGPEDCCYQNTLIRYRAGPETDANFAVQLFRYCQAIGIFSRIAVKTNSIAHLGVSRFAELELPFPPLPEQRKIAEILRTWDEAIEKLEALRADNENQYKALARRFFDPCHPTFHGRPNTWREFELGDIFRERSQSGDENDRLLSVTMNGGVIDRDEVGRKDTSTEDKSKYKLILPGDIGYNTMRMWQGVSGLSALRGIISPAYTVVTPVPNWILGRYAAHLFKSRRMVFDFERYSQGLTSDTWNLKFPAFSKIKVFVPPIEDQDKQADLLDALTAESAVLGKQIEALARQKRGLMQKLLTGEWRVSEALEALPGGGDDG